jgi:hypothetical protein
MKNERTMTFMEGGGEEEKRREGKKEKERKVWSETGEKRNQIDIQIHNCLMNFIPWFLLCFFGFSILP